MKSVQNTAITRRRFFAATSLAAISIGSQGAARVPARLSDDTFQYEVNRTDEEWVAMLKGDEYAILREGYTEQPKSSPLWNETREGTYHCKGCELHVFDSSWKRELNKGWVFFYHSVINSVMTDIDGPTPEYGQMAGSDTTVMEIHCRRCGSHLGHLLIVEKEMSHCINGAAMTFEPAAA